jgi:hypothetical protein
MHLSAGEKMQDALRKAGEEIAGYPTVSKNEYDRLPEQYGRHFAFGDRRNLRTPHAASQIK